ncbi:MAG: biotin transporter BioY [bacterium]
MRILARTKEEVFVKKFSLALLFMFATGLGAQLRISLPFTPVPITFQTFFVLSSGAVLGPFWGLISQILYIFFGSLGFPYFSGWSAGLRTLIGPTGGYIIGFAVASYLVGKLTEKELKLKRLYLAMVLGEVVILLSGFLWLGISLSLTPYQAFLKGVLPFLPGDAMKILAGGLFSISISRWTRN